MKRALAVRSVRSSHLPKGITREESCQVTDSYDPTEAEGGLISAPRDGESLFVGNDGRARPQREAARLAEPVSTTFKATLDFIRRVAPTSISVVLRGASGTGKELCAREIHERSARRDGPFVAVNCGGIPETLIESELFGCERGAYTGAHARRIGLFEQAHGGTLFLDEIGELPLSMQPKLLRALQEHQITRLGGIASIPIDVRIVSATHRDLVQMMRDGTFREDLFYRAAPIIVRLPSLRERGEDIPVLARELAARLGRKHIAREVHLSAAALDALTQYPWPGNVRELESVISCSIALIASDPTRAELDVGDIRFEAEFDYSVLSDLEAEIHRAGVETNWNQELIAERVGRSPARVSQLINASPTLRQSRQMGKRRKRRG